MTTDSQNPWLIMFGYHSPNLVKRLRDGERMDRNKRKDVRDSKLTWETVSSQDDPEKSHLGFSKREKLAV
jgi:pimeloyl-CoA synthetase